MNLKIIKFSAKLKTIKGIKNLLLLIFPIVILILLYFSPLNLRTVTADNVDDFEKIPFNLIYFRPSTTETKFDYDNFAMFSDFTDINAKSKIEYEKYQEEYEVFYGENSNNTFNMNFSSNKKHIRLIGNYPNNSELPQRVYLSPFAFYLWYKKNYPNEFDKYGDKYAHKRYGNYFNNYTNKLFDNLKEQGYILYETKLKKGNDILIDNHRSKKRFLIVRKLINGYTNKNMALEFFTIHKKKINISLLEKLF